MILRATTLDHDVVVTAPEFAGTYRSVAALQPSALQARASLQVDGLDLQGVLSLRSGITADEIRAGLWDAATVDVFVVDWSDTSVARHLTGGVIGNHRYTEEGGLTLEVRTLTDLVAQEQGPVFSTKCIAELGSGDEVPVIRRCGVDIANHRHDEPITAVAEPRRSFEVAGLTEGGGWATKGRVIVLTGAAAGAVREIRFHDTGGFIAVYEPFPADLEVGDDVRIEAGCDKLFSTCGSKFANAVNFRGQPDIPGPGYVARLALTETD